MERLVLVVDQLEEVKRFITVGDISRLRLALLLLDNASEILMYRAVTNALLYHDMHARLFERAKEIMPPTKLETFRSEMGFAPLSSQQRKALDRDYNAKVDFLVSAEKHRQMPAPIGRVLKATHKYRNEAYHRDHVRKATLSPVVVVLFDVVTDLLSILTSGSMSYSSSHDWSNFCRRYGFHSLIDMLDKGIPVIVAALKKDMNPNVESIAGSLADHILSRIDEMEDALNFVAHSGSGFSVDQELKWLQFWAAYQFVPHQGDDPRFKEYTAPRSLADFETWRAAANKLRDERDKLALFGYFSDLEGEIEPLEEKIDEAASILDEAIQLEIDRARGK